MKPKVLIVTGFGENCATELKYAFDMAGANTTISHINSILNGEIKLKNYHIFNWGGGFLDGDDLGSAKAGANRLKFTKIGKLTFQDDLNRFILDGKLIAGQCNGFQLLVKLGILPFNSKQSVSLTNNLSGKFEDRWINVTVPKNSKCIWTRGIKVIKLPVRHGEGRLVCSNETKEILKKDGHIALQYCDEFGNVLIDYPFNPNGSIEAIAGLCDKTGQILGLMPHPEAFCRFVNSPNWTYEKLSVEKQPFYGSGFAIFQNAVKYIEEEWK